LLFGADRVVSQYEQVYERVLVNGDFDLAALFAHPDDAELVVGGTLAREARGAGGWRSLT
jgi:hypothetical protein